MSSLYKPPGYLDFQEFFAKVLDVVLEGPTVRNV